MGGVCPARIPAAVPKLQKQKQEEAVGKLGEAVGKLGKANVTTPVALPTKSWRALLEEANFSNDALVQPEDHMQALKSSPPSQKLTNVHGRTWEVHSKQPLPKESARRGPDLQAKLRFRKGIPVNMHATSPAPDDAVAMPGGFTGDGGGSMTIQTQTYMELLKAGGQKKKPPGLTAISPPFRQNQSAEAMSFGASDARWKLQNRGSPPITAGSLQQTWHNVWKPQKGAAEQGLDEEAAIVKVVQDDIQLGKLTADQDISDPAYWSETESADNGAYYNNASAHRLGRRQNCKAPSYVMQDLSLSIDKTVGMMLSRLQRFGSQQRTFKQGNIPQPERRFVIGMKEVTRRIKQQKVACIIVAPDLEGDPTEGGLDDRVREILAASYKESIPVIFALSRRRLGLALGKDMTISIIGCLDLAGTKDLFNDALKLTNDGRQAWLTRREKVIQQLSLGAAAAKK